MHLGPTWLVLPEEEPCVTAEPIERPYLGCTSPELVERLPAAKPGSDWTIVLPPLGDEEWFTRDVDAHVPSRC